MVRLVILKLEENFRRDIGANMDILKHLVVINLFVVAIFLTNVQVDFLDGQARCVTKNTLISVFIHIFHIFHILVPGGVSVSTLSRSER